MSEFKNSEFTNMKIRVKDEEHSKQIQEVLFSLGYKWRSSSTKPSYLDKKFVYTYIDGDITYGGDEHYFKYVISEEVTLEDLQSLLSDTEDRSIDDTSIITSDCTKENTFTNEISLLQEVLDSIEVSMYLLDESNVNYSPKTFEMYLKGVINTARIMSIMKEYRGEEKVVDNLKEKLDVYERVDCALVPKEPTVEMVKAGIVAGGTVWAKDIYKAMIKAGEVR